MSSAKVSLQHRKVSLLAKQTLCPLKLRSSHRGMAEGDDDVPLILTWDDTSSGLLEEDESE